MPEEPPPLVHVFLTGDPLANGEIGDALARIEGDTAIYGPYGYQITGEGRGWHRTRWAAENYARQLQATRLQVLRAEIERIEGYRFGRPGR